MDGTRDWGHMPSMNNLPADLHLCKSAEALVSGVACYRLSRNWKLTNYFPFLTKTSSVDCYESQCIQKWLSRMCTDLV